MSISTITSFHAAPGREKILAELLASGRDRMRDAEGCESFELLREEADPGAMVFLQQWSGHPAHDVAFSQRIAQSGHLDEVLAQLDGPIVRQVYYVA